MKKYIILLVLLFKFFNAFPQTNGDALLKEQLYYQVKQLDEFINRFNYKTDVYGKSIEEGHKFTRTEYIFSIFDSNYLRQLDSKSVNTIKEFVKYITEKQPPLYLQRNENLYALAQCQVTYKGRNQAVSLLLKIELAPNGAAKWVLSDVKADFLELPPRKNDPSIYIAPNSNETNFMSIRKELEKTQQITDYATKDFQTDIFSIFLFEIYNKNLKITSVDKITYHFFQIDGYTFSVDFFNRPEKNSGWLISKLIRTEGDKAQYIKNLIK